MVKKGSNIKKEVVKTRKEAMIGNIPEGVMILSVILFAGALICMMLALWMFNAADQLPLYAEELSQISEQEIGVTVFVNLGLLFVVFSLISYFIGRGLLKLQNRARIVLILIMILSIGMSIFNIFWASQIYSSVFTALINAVAIWYLVRKETIKVFK